MTDGFDDTTVDLSEDELKFIPLIIAGLRRRKGPDTAISSQIICDRLNERNHDKSISDCKMSPIRLRKCINHIRRHGLLNFVIGSSTGYYVSHDPGVVKRAINELYREAATVKARADAMQEYLNKELSTSQQKMKL